jgi:serine phosphatase RsbU (regulator of sigma subunit)
MRTGTSPQEAVRLLYERGDELRTRFATAFVATIVLTTGRSTYCNAGHPPALLADTDGVQLCMPTGP